MNALIRSDEKSSSCVSYRGELSKKNNESGKWSSFAFKLERGAFSYYDLKKGGMKGTLPTQYFQGVRPTPDSEGTKVDKKMPCRFELRCISGTYYFSTTTFKSLEGWCRALDSWVGVKTPTTRARSLTHTSDDEDERHTCAVCSKVYPTSADLVTHRRLRHDGGGSSGTRPASPPPVHRGGPPRPMLRSSVSTPAFGHPAGGNAGRFSQSVRQPGHPARSPAASPPVSPRGAAGTSGRARGPTFLPPVPGSSYPVELPSAVPDHVCAVCGKAYLLQADLDYHSKLRHGAGSASATSSASASSSFRESRDAPLFPSVPGSTPPPSVVTQPPASQPTPVPSSTPTHACPVCSRVYFTKADVMTHVKLRHEGEAPEVYGKLTLSRPVGPPPTHNAARSPPASPRSMPQLPRASAVQPAAAAPPAAAPAAAAPANLAAPAAPTTRGRSTTQAEWDAIDDAIADLDFDDI